MEGERREVRDERKGRRDEWEMKILDRMSTQKI